MVTGDFNATKEEVSRYCRRELELELSLSPIDGTRHGRNDTMSTLDYIMASPGMEVSDTECLH